MIKKPFTDLSQAEKYFPQLYGSDFEMQKERYKNAFDNFKKHFTADSAYIASSSGRVEVVGNHTDHNGGKVISCAISLDTLSFFLPTNDGIIRIISEGYKDIVIDTAKEEKYVKGTSFSLVCGVVAYFKKHGYNVGGFNAFCTSNVCGGAGISSSASFEVLIAEILSFLYNNDKLTAEEKAKASQYAENVFFGKPCGLLDQSAIAYGGLKKLDFSDKDKINVSEIKNDLSDYTLVLVNTGGSHADLTDEYAAVPAEIFSVAKVMGVSRLIDLSEKEFFEKLSKCKDSLSDRAICRAIHFYQENSRVDSAEHCLNCNDYGGFLNAIDNSGISSLWKLQNCYVAGAKEQPIPKALSIISMFIENGACRVHGGGFAGCVLNVIKNDNVEKFISNITKFYDKKDVLVLHVRSVGTIIL